MTLEQLFSPASRDWFHKKNLEINEGAKLSNDEICEEFEKWFSDNIDLVNESAKLIEARKTVILDDDDVDDENAETVNDDVDDDLPEETKGMETDDVDDDIVDTPSDENNDDIEDNDVDDKEEKIEDENDDIEDETSTETPEETGVDKDEDEDEMSFGDESTEGGVEDDYTEPEEEAVSIEDEDDDETLEKPSATRGDKSKIKKELESTSEGSSRYIVNNGRDPLHNIYQVVNTWYDNAVIDGTNTDTVTPLYYFNTSHVDNMTALFAFANIPNLDISSWDVSNVRNMEGMFYKSTFNNHNIEGWDVSNCINFRNMFYQSKFSGDLRRWVTGIKEEQIYDEETGEPLRIKVLRKDEKTIVTDSEAAKDPEMKTWKWKAATKEVHVEPPFVGARDEHDTIEKTKKILSKMSEFDDEIAKEKEIRKSKSMKDDDDELEMEEGKNLKNIFSYDEFINEGLGSFFKKGVDKVKNFFKSFAVKINDYYLAVFGKDGNLLPVVSPYTAFNYITKNHVGGVQIFTKDPSIPDGVIPESNEQYGFIEPGTVEYKNYQTFVNMINESYEATGEQVFEAIMPLQSEGSGVGVEDITSKDLKEILNNLLTDAPAYKENGGKAVCIFGAPGIGKSTIPKEVVKEYNKGLGEGKDKLKSVMVVNCGDLTLDGFYLPLPKYTSLSDLAKTHPKLHDTLVTSGVDVEKFSKKIVRQTMEAPKTWLPCYVESVDREENELMNNIANGYIVNDRVYDEKMGKYVDINKESTEGGILLFDEFFRADPEIFKILMQIILERKTQGGMKIGDKWAILCCSNRPNDDNEVKMSRDESSPVLGNRFLGGVYNFIPDFEDWAKWADKKGLLDPYTTMFLTGNPSSDDSTERNEYEMTLRDAETDTDITLKGYHRWHNVDPDLYKSSGENSVFMFPTPRTWAALLEWIKDEKERLGVKSVLSIPPGSLRKKARGVIGKKTADDYVDFLKTLKESGLTVKRVFETPGYKADPDTCDITTATEFITTYVKNRWNNNTKYPSSKDDELFVNMFNFLENSYVANGISGSFIITLHSNIVRNILNIKSTNVKKIARLKNYIDLVRKEYNIKFADEAI